MDWPVRGLFPPSAMHDGDVPPLIITMFAAAPHRPALPCLRGTQALPRPCQGPSCLLLLASSLLAAAQQLLMSSAETACEYHSRAMAVSREIAHSAGSSISARLERVHPKQRIVALPSPYSHVALYTNGFVMGPGKNAWKPKMQHGVQFDCQTGGELHMRTSIYYPVCEAAYALTNGRLIPRHAGLPIRPAPTAHIKPALLFQHLSAVHVLQRSLRIHDRGRLLAKCRKK